MCECNCDDPLFFPSCLRKAHTILAIMHHHHPQMATSCGGELSHGDKTALC